MKKPEFKTAVEISREWEGDKVADELVKKLKAKTPNPKFILLFTTIHYEKEFKKILSGIKNAFPNSPLIGGTVAGFITPEGCFTRGVTCLAIDYSNMKISVGIGYDTKRNPTKASKEFSEKIKASNKKLKNNLIFDIISGPVVPQFPRMGRINVSFSKSRGALLSKLLSNAGKFGTGVGKEEEIIKNLIKNFSNSFLFGLSSMDDGKMIKNYQFLDEEITTNSIVGLNIETDLNFNILFTHGLIETEKKFKITKISEDGRIVKELDGKPAVDRFMEAMGWSKEWVGNLDKFYRTTFFYPFGFKKGKVICPCNIGGFLGADIPLGYSVESKELLVLSASGNSLIEATKKITQIASSDKKLNIIVNCGATLEALGDNVFKIRDVLMKKFKSFIVIYGSGENFYKPLKEGFHLNESIILLQI